MKSKTKSNGEHRSRRTAIHEAGHVAAAVAFGIPIISVTIIDRPRLHRGTYRPLNFMAGLECIVTLCMAGSEAERAFFGSIPEGIDATDRRMAREYLSRRFTLSEIEAPLSHCRDAAARLVRSRWGQRHVEVIAEALLTCGELTGDEVGAIVGGFAHPFRR
jgi:hypothetical protein